MYLASLMKLSTCFTGIRISVNVAAAAIACAVKLWQMGSRNPVEILEGSSDCRLSLTVYCTQPVVWCQSEPCLGEHFSLQEEGLNEEHCTIFWVWVFMHFESVNMWYHFETGLQ